MKKNESSTAFPPALPGLELEETLEELREVSIARRLWAKDASLWKSDPKIQNSIRQRLGWLDLPSTMGIKLDEINGFVKKIRSAGYKEAVLLGMGGSSLCPEVLRQTFGIKPGFLRLTVLDTTDPAAIAAVAKRANLRKTLFLVSSKSGGTIEVSSLFRFFWAKVEAVRSGKAGEQFVAITDPGTPLEKLARERGFRHTFLAPADVGGRFSALTFFGLVPAALIGVDLRRFLERADRMAQASGGDRGVDENPGAWLGAVLGAAAEAGRDKMTLLTSPALRSFGLWAEQLIAESTGKEGAGVVPVESEPVSVQQVEGRDRLFVSLTLKGAPGAVAHEKALKKLEKAGHPVVRLELKDRMDLAGEFFRWEMATAVVGQCLGINPFDEPNVSESKANTTKFLSMFEASKSLPEDRPDLVEQKRKWWAAQKTKAGTIADALEGFLSLARRGDYVALLAYVTPTEENTRALQDLRRRIHAATGCATTLGFGPRFLHSTGQLHKGGASNGLFLQITAEDVLDLPIPGMNYGFSVLKMAQALGDFQALKEHKRRAVRLYLTKAVAKDLKGLGRRVKAAVTA